MDDAHDGPYAREPQLDDLAGLARALNAHQARYVLIGAADRQFLQVLIDEAAR